MKNEYFLLCGLLLLGCAKVEEETRPDDEPVREGITYTLTGELSEQTKALISDEGDFSWEPGDQVAVLDALSGDLCTFTSETGDGKFTFTGEPERTYNFTKAWYPASMAKVADTITFPSEWSYDDLSRAHYFPMAATVTDGRMPFYHLGGLIKLTINDVPKNATSLVFSSEDVALSGTFGITDLGLDDGRVDATGEPVVVENGTIAVKSVSEIEAEEGEAGAVSIGLNLPAKQTVTAYIPLPCGSYRYKITLKVEDTSILEKGTSAAKDIDRAVMVQMKALSVSWPETTLQACYGDTKVDFEAADLWGWFKAPNLPTGQNISLVDKVSGTVYGARHSTQKKAGFFVQCLSGDAAKGFPLYEASDLYISTDRTKFFPAKSGASPTLPAEYEVAHFRLRGSFDGGEYATIGMFTKTEDRAKVSGWGWYVVRNVPCTASQIAFKLYAHSKADYGLVVATTTTPQNVGAARGLTWNENGQPAISFNVTSGMNYDFYLREDLQQIILFESGSQGAMDEERIVSLSNYGLYYYNNASWVYTPRLDQTWNTGSTFVMVDGVTFDTVQFANLPASPAVGDEVTVNVTIAPSIGSTTTPEITARIVKVEGKKVWLLSESGTGMIVNCP